MEQADGWTAYFDPTRFPNQQSLHDTIRSLSSQPFRISTLPTVDWGEEWKKNFKPVRASRRFVVRPSWETYVRRAKDKVIIIEPKMAFGTGTHETTQLVLQIIDDHMKSGARVLDVGTGSGILAIAAVKLKARSVLALDIEAEAIENAEENIRRNRVGARVRLFHGSVGSLSARDRRPYDWILANLQRSLIENVLSDLFQLLREDGTLVISGILYEEDDVVQEMIRHTGFRIEEARQRGEWMAYRLEKTI